MENIVTLLPPLGELARPTKRSIEPIARSAELHALVLRRQKLAIRPTYLISVNRRAERIYALATTAAVVVMTSALVMAFGICLKSFVG
jgi:hypothetical protein